MNHRVETPTVIVDWIMSLLNGRAARIVCDPWLEDGKLLTHLKKATGAKEVVGLTASSQVAAAVRHAIKGGRIEVGDPLEVLRKTGTEFDVIAGILPFGMQGTRADFEGAKSGEKIELRGELGHLLLVQAGQRLKADGLGVFVVSPAFFLHSSVFHRLGYGAQVPRLRVDRRRILTHQKRAPAPSPPALRFAARLQPWR